MSRRSGSAGTLLVAVATAALLLLAVALSAPREGSAAHWAVVGLALSLAVLSGAALLWEHRRRKRFARLSARLHRLAETPVEGAEEQPPGAGSEALDPALDRLLTSWRARAGELADERDHYREILRALSDGVLEIDGHGRLLLANPAFRALLEIDGEADGRTLPELTRHPELEDLGRRALAGELPTEAEVSLGGGRVARISGRPLPGGGALLLARNVTERARFDTTRRDFVANISHEIKTPLTAIRGYAETLEEGALEEPATARRFIGRILLQCRRLEALLADLLALSRMESAGFMAEENLQPVDLEQLCRRALETLAGLARERGVELELDARPVPRLVGYPEALERLLLNLLDNAIKYNRAGGRVRVLLRRLDGQVELAVSDNGIGIPEAALPRVFERFYRVDKGRARAEGGTGLGLALVKHAAMLHRGEVEVESALGRGSTFRVTLPLPAPGAPAPQST
ncbi:MAG: ATP-binding protein [Thermoanaerobaculia bacterium]|nr:ATP-binding protein [Thermoanaerobaculia bacterium]